VFGTELVKHTKYTFKSGAKFAVYTYHGCQIAVITLLLLYFSKTDKRFVLIYFKKVSGKLEVQPYTSRETPMTMYLNVHAGLEQARFSI
jgi:polyribonucleotide 5'-hydroxyl-kinase